MIFRQGDVLLSPAQQVEGTKLANLILAKGELTGHAHRITEGLAELYESEGTLYLRVISETAWLTHEEHHPIEVPKGDWFVRIQREYTPAHRWHQVVD